MSSINKNCELEQFIIYQYKFSHLDFYTAVGNVLYKILLATVVDIITYTVSELCELRDTVNICELVSINMIYVMS